MKIVDVAVDLVAAASPFGQVKGGHLLVEGYLAKGTLLESDLIKDDFQFHTANIRLDSVKEDGKMDEEHFETSTNSETDEIEKGWKKNVLKQRVFRKPKKLKR